MSIGSRATRVERITERIASRLLAAAEGAVHAYAAITGDEWKPYEGPSVPAGNVSRQAAAAELDALG